MRDWKELVSYTKKRAIISSVLIFSAGISVALTIYSMDKMSPKLAVLFFAISTFIGLFGAFIMSDLRKALCPSCKKPFYGEFRFVPNLQMMIEGFKETQCKNCKINMFEKL